MVEEKVWILGERRGTVWITITKERLKKMENDLQKKIQAILFLEQTNNKLILTKRFNYNLLKRFDALLETTINNQTFAVGIFDDKKKNTYTKISKRKCDL